MNKNRRNRLKKIQDALESIIGQVEEISDEESDAFDNMPDSLKDGDRGALMQQAIDALDYVKSNITDAINELDTAMET